MHRKGALGLSPAGPNPLTYTQQPARRRPPLSCGSRSASATPAFSLESRGRLVQPVLGLCGVAWEVTRHARFSLFMGPLVGDGASRA